MRHGFVDCGFVLAVGLLVSGDLDAGSLEPPGPPAPTMKTIQQVEPRTPISSLPVTIAAPGSYYLTDNLTGVSGQAGITIMSSFVTLDLNGFSLIGVPGSLDGINSSLSVLEHIVIRNGVIRSWGGRGISAFNTSEVHVGDLRLEGNGSDGLRVGPRSIVRDTTSSGNGGTGFYVETGSTVIGCTASVNGLSGVVAQANSVVSTTTATLHGTQYGFSLTASVATDCTAQQNFIGFSVGTGGRVVHSQARANSIGIFGEDGVSIEECTVDSNTNDGIRISDRGRVSGNLARNNTNDGIEATGSHNRIEHNQAGSNGVGIRVTGVSNLVVQNSAGGNGTEYVVAGGNQFATASVNPNTAGPWANFDL